MSRTHRMPPRSSAAEAAARVLRHPVVVVLTLDERGDRVETYCYGRTKGHRLMAGAIADIAAEAVSRSEPPAGLDQAVALVNASPAGRAS